MNKLNSLFNTSKNRIGFHYFPDTLHYREVDLQRWLPELTALKTSWLVIESPVDRAIPEKFITSLMQAGIQPIVQFKLSLAEVPDTARLEPILSSYARWGIRGVIFFDRPNNRSSWSSTTWVQQGLVGRFLERFLPLANLAMQNGLNPIFPPLEPGGNYWDTAFLRSALEALEQDKQTLLLQNLVIAAYAWNRHDILNWGSGGPQRWTDTHPYFTPANQQDQRGFRIYDWYNAITQAVLQKSCPIIMLGAGAASDPNDKPSRVYTPEQHTAINLAIVRTLYGEKVSDPAASKTAVEPVPDYVIACNFWLLTTELGDPYQNQAWFHETGQVLPTVQVLKNYFIKMNNQPAVQAPPAAPQIVSQPAVSAQPAASQQPFPNPVSAQPVAAAPVRPPAAVVAAAPSAPAAAVPVAAVAAAAPVAVAAPSAPASPPAPAAIAGQPASASKYVAFQVAPAAPQAPQANYQRPIQHYLLLPTYEWGVADWHLEVIRPFIKKYRPTVGFSVKEAALAKRVTVIGNTQTFPELLLDQLRQVGCLVERISGDGTSVATQLAER
jgi:hypothetical protein